MTTTTSAFLHGLGLSLLVVVAGGRPLHGQDEYLKRAREAQAAGNHQDCLANLDRLEGESSAILWMRVQCLQAIVEAVPNNAATAAELLVASQRYIAFLGGNLKGREMENAANTRQWRDGLRKRFDHDGLRYGALRYEDLPADQRNALDTMEQVLAEYTDDLHFTDTMKRRFQSAVQKLHDLTLPMRDGASPVVACLKKDAVLPLRTLNTQPWYDEGDNDERDKRLLAAAIAANAPEITSYILNERIVSSKRNYDMEKGLLDIAVKHRAHSVLKRWYDASVDRDGSLVKLTRWDTLAPLYVTPLARSALHNGDSLLLDYALRFHTAIPRDTLGNMVFSAMEAGQPRLLGMLLAAEPPTELQDAQGMSYLHRALAMDAPELLKVLLKQGWFEKLEHALDNDGLPAPHYLVTRDLPEVLKTPDLLQHLHMEATDIEGFGLLHRLVFRPDSMAIPAETVMEAVLKNTKYLKLNTQGPHHGWTALHYAARENKPKLVALLVKGGRGDKRQKDSTWKRTPKDVAKDMAREHGQRGPLKAM